MPFTRLDLVRAQRRLDACKDKIRRHQELVHELRSRGQDARKAEWDLAVAHIEHELVQGRVDEIAECLHSLSPQDIL